MKTKYWPTLVIGGFLVALSFNLILIVFGILSMGYGLQLRLLAKKGIEDSKDVKRK